MENHRLYSKKKKTLHRAWIASFVGLVAVLFAYKVGESSIIFADFLRRGIEFLSLFISWIVFLVINKKTLSAHAGKKLEFISGFFIVFIMLFSFISISYNAYIEFLEPTETGWLLPGMVVASIAIINNSYFWRKYKKIVREESTQIIESQRRLYRSKVWGDGTVLITLLLTQFLGSYHWQKYIDPAGSVLIALFILFSAIKILKENISSLRADDFS